MIQIENITAEAHQRHTILFQESEVILTLRFYPTVSMWCFDAEYKTSVVSGMKLSVGVLHMRSRNLPFDFAVIDTLGDVIDPFRLDDFETGRCELYMLEPADMALIRATPVPI
ncbi:MAG: hypothetical protein JKY80_01945 [Mariprofundaceae bacterium]|nr:hypothetical protein [Methylophaga sp.]MBL4759602.1 hypothetical protein [Mariprofundaceae bacterium]